MAITSSRGERTATSFCDFGNACCNFSRSRCVTPFRLAHTGEMNFEGLLFARANRPQGGFDVLVADGSVLIRLWTQDEARALPEASGRV